MASLLIAQEGTPAEARLMRFPAIHGDTVVFTYASDLWVANRKGTEARRLTSHPGDEVRARISPDGTLVAFSATYDGNPDVYVVPISGGAPKRLTFDPNTDNVIGWTPDGKIMFTSGATTHSVRITRLCTIDPAGGLPNETVLEEVSDGSFFADGKRFAYNRVNSHTQNWRRYRGGRQGKISLYDFSNNTYEELPSKRENSWFPMVVGRSIYYASDRNEGTVNLYRYDLDSKRDAQLTNFGDADIKWPSTDGKSIVYERDGYLYSYDIAGNRTDKLTFRMPSDELGRRPYTLKVGRRIGGFSISPSGARVAVEARGDIFTLSTKGEARPMSQTPGARERQPEWSPDGKMVTYLSDESGEYQIVGQPNQGGEKVALSDHKGVSIRNYQWSPDGKWITFSTTANDIVLLDPKTKVERPVYKIENDGTSVYSWSPDGRWIAYSLPGKNGFGALHMYEVATGKSTKITEGLYDDQFPTFDLNGKYLYFTSARTFSPTPGRYELSLKVEDADRIYVLPLAKDTPNPLFPKPEEEPDGTSPAPSAPNSEVRIDFDGIEGRAIALPIPAGGRAGLNGARDGVFYNTFDGTEGLIRKFDLNRKRSITILRGGPLNLSFNPSRTKLAYASGDVLAVADVAPDIVLGTGRIDTSGLETTVDPAAEWKQMFWETWRLERDNFYDPKILGQDWNAVGARYAKYLPYVTHRSDLSYVLGLMIGELGTSHSYVNPPPGDFDAERFASAAMLGADYEASNGLVRFRHIYPGALSDESLRGPLGEPGLNVKAGDYLLEIDGHAVDAKTHPNSLLLNKANKVVTLLVNDRPSREGARRIMVRPVPNETQLRYMDWVEENRRKVAQMSGGRIGYLHYPSTGPDGQVEFIRGYYGQTDKDAMIFDDRYNSGGYVQPMVVPTFGRASQSLTYSRNRTGVGSELSAVNGPKVMLTNYYAGSGGDFTPWLFKDAKLGTLIGTRTLGGLVGISGYYNLMDAGQVSAPSFAFYDPKTGEWIAENKGIDPDIYVDARPDLRAKGQDPQLEKAVEVLMAQLRADKTKKADRPPFPTVRKGSK
jgi:tricorn protease